MLFCLLSLQAFCQGFWLREYYYDDFGDIMYDKPYIYNSMIRNSSLKLNLQFESRGLIVSLISDRDNRLFSVDGPATISIKQNSTGKVYSSTAIDAQGGRLMFGGSNLVDILLLIEEGNCKIVIKANKYLEPRSFVFNVKDEATGFTAAVRKYLLR